MPFLLSRTDARSAARTGSLALGHGTVQTPCFMPVGTNATVKAMRTDDLESIGARLILGNAYHLYLRPGAEVIAAAGGLHAFMGWPHNILTDSGGYQVFSLAPFRKVTEEGVAFKSHIDGSSHNLRPEDVVRFECLLGSDVLMPLDVCTAPGITREEAADAMRLTTRWLERSRTEWLGSCADRGPTPRGELFGIMQGNFFKDLRTESASRMIELDLPGYAVGGLSVGEEFGLFQELLHHSAALLPSEKPRYLMGVGTPRYILEAVEAGIDMFDCVFPTRTARNAQVFTADGPLALRNEKYRLDFGPIDPACRCSTCRAHSRAYLRHLFKAKEIQAAVLATMHNLAFLQSLVLCIRDAIGRGDFLTFKADFLLRYGSGQNSAGNADPVGEGLSE
jgi:queuine tRNA-ribosyltransferase